MDWNSLQNTVAAFYHHWQSLAYVLFVLLGTLVVASIIHLLLRKRYKRPGTGMHVWHDAILGALNAPLQGIVWIIGLSLAEGILASSDRLPVLADVFPPARNVAIIAMAAWYVIRLTHRATANLNDRAAMRNQHFDATAADAIVKFITAITVIAAALVILQTLGFSVTSLLAFGGVAGIALGFAAQGLVANLLGGITIYASRPFKVGEQIIFPGMNPTGSYVGWQAGKVQHIGWRATRILDWNGKPFYVPNAKFNTETVINHSRMAFREIAEYVYVRLQDIDKVRSISDDVQQMLKNHPDMGDFVVFRFNSYGEHALKFYLYAYTTSAGSAYTEYTRIKEDVLLKIAAIIAQHGAQLAVPVTSVDLTNSHSSPHQGNTQSNDHSTV